MRKRLTGPIKFFLDIAPLLAFFAGYKMGGIMLGTGLIIPVTLAAFCILYYFERKIAWSPLITAVVVCLFGGMTLFFHNELFIKIKPTIINLIFAAILSIGVLHYRVGLLKYLFGPVFQMTEEGWRRLSIRWAWFFLALAILNEIVWRHTTTDVWVNFKVFGLIGLMIVFSMSQMPFVSRHIIEDAAAKPD